MREFFAILAFVCSTTFARADLLQDRWPEVADGGKLEIKIEGELSTSLQRLKRENCLTDERFDWVFEFYSFANKKIAVLSCSYGVASSAIVFKLVDGRTEKLIFAHGMPGEGFLATDTFSSLSVNQQNGEIEANFSSDSCGTVPEIGFRYQLQEDRYFLSEAFEWDCNKRTVGKILWRFKK